MKLLISSHRHVAVFLLISFSLAHGQSSTSIWESIGPSGGSLGPLVQNPVTGDLIAVAVGPPAKIYKSTNDGSTWTKISDVRLSNGNESYLSFLALNPQNPRELVGIPWGQWYWPQYQAADSNNCQVLKSTDGGVSWITKSFRGEVGWTYQFSRMRIEQDGSLSIMGHTFRETAPGDPYQPFLCRSTNWGESWSIRRFPNAVTGKPIINAVTVDPANSNIVYVGGYLVRPDGFSEMVLQRTTDNGSTWSSLVDSVIWGNLYDIRFSPNSSSVVFVATDVVTFRSTNRGASWEPRSSGWLTKPAKELQFDPKNASVVYGYGYGPTITRSTDGGANWMVLRSPFQGGSISKLLIHPTKPYKLYATSSDGFFKSENASQDWIASSSGISSVKVPAIRCVPDNPKTLYVSKLGSGLYRTTNAQAATPEGGISWDKLPDFNISADIDKIIISEESSPKIYVLQAHTGGAQVVSMSTDGGLYWNEIDRTIEGFDLNYTGSLYVVGSSLHNVAPRKRMALRKSSNDGASWEQFPIDDSLSIGYAVLPNPVNDSIVYVGGSYTSATSYSFLRLYKTTDKGKTWRRIDSGFNTFEGVGVIYALETDKAHPDRIFAALSNGTYRSTDGGITWSQVNNLNGNNCIVIDESNPNVVYAAASGSSQSSAVLRSTNGGVTWSAFSEGVEGQRILSMDLDSRNQVLYVGTLAEGVFRRFLAGGGGKPTSVSTTHRVALFQGWNTISSYVAPRDSTIDSVFAGIRSRLNMVKDGSGRVYWPSQGINSIGKWDPRGGYFLNMKTIDTLTITGEEIDPRRTTFSLAPGWNSIGYLRNGLMRADSALGALVNKAVIAKDNSGGVYWPLYGINTIGSLRPGQGYQVNVAGSVAFTYPANATVAPPNQLTKSDGAPVPFTAQPLRHKPATTCTGVNATLLVEGKSLREGDEVGAWTTEGLLVGSGLVNEGRAIVTIWGDDVATTNTEGAVSQEPVSLTQWSSADGVEHKLKVRYVTDVPGTRTDETLRFRPDGIFIASVDGESNQLPITFELGQNYPNPFNPATVIRFQLPSAEFVTLKVFDVLGREIATLVEGVRQPGTYSVRWDASVLTSGVYFYNLRAGDNIASRKMLLMK